MSPEQLGSPLIAADDGKHEPFTVVTVSHFLWLVGFGLVLCKKHYFWLGSVFWQCRAKVCLSSSITSAACTSWRYLSHRWAMAAKSLGRVSNTPWDETNVAFEFHPMLRSAAALLTPVAFLLAYFPFLYDDSVRAVNLQHEVLLTVLTTGGPIQGSLATALLLSTQ